MNGYFDIETQFLGPLPIPSATPEEKEKVSELGESLQELHTKKHNKLKALEKRFEVCPEEKHDEDWLWPEVKTVAHWKTQAPRNLSSQQKTQWAKEKRDGLIDKRWHTIQARLSQDANLVPDFSDGELFFSIDGVPIVDHVFVEENMGEQILVHWRHIARTTSITEKSTAKRLTDLLRAPRVTDNPALADQLCKLDVEVGQLDEEIAGCEQKMDSLLFDLYQLSDDERRLVQS